MKLLKCNGGIIIDGTPYGFEGMLSSLFSGEVDQKNCTNTTNWADLAMEILNNEIRPHLTRLQEQFAQAKHLFLSGDDMKLVNKYLSQCEKRYNEVAVKVQNSKGLL